MRIIFSKVEFSKIILIIATLINMWVIGFTCYMIYITRDLTPLTYLVPSTAAEVAAGTAFYYWKAKAENIIKLKRENPDIDHEILYDDTE